MSTFPEESPLAKRLHAVYRRYAGNMGLGDHLPETWNAVAEEAERAAIEHECNDCGIMIENHLELCSLCQRHADEQANPEPDSDRTLGLNRERD